MKIVQTQKYIRTSPRKLRMLAAMVRGMEASKAIEVLPYTGKRAAAPLVKTIKAAVANAKDRKVEAEELRITEVQINEGPVLKRGRAVSRGMWHPYQRKMSHIRVVIEPVVSEKKEETKSEKKEKEGKKEVKKSKETKKKDENKKSTKSSSAKAKRGKGKEKKSK